MLPHPTLVESGKQFMYGDSTCPSTVSLSTKGVGLCRFACYESFVVRKTSLENGDMLPFAPFHCSHTPSE